jgi:signal transduction histidine kinase
MEQENTTNPLLELIDRPAFFVREGVITEVNQAAQQLLLCPGAEIETVLPDCMEAYRAFTDGSLSLTAVIADFPYQAQVARTESGDIFILDAQHPELRAIALAAQHLRNPLNSIMTVADQLCSEDTEQLAQLQRGLYRLHRIVCNMSDSYRYQQPTSARLETADITRVFDDSMEAIGTHLTACGTQLKYTGLNRMVIGLADREMLERAVYNLISNAVKFMSAGSALEAKLTQNGNVLCFTVQNQQSASMPQNRPFNRYLREPGIEDSRNGIGLGMALVRAVAAIHGGTVLVDTPQPQSTRITMTITVTSNPDHKVHSNIKLPISNYAGDRDRGLLELSEVLPTGAYKGTD